MQHLDLSFHSRVPIPFDFSTREGFFLLSQMSPDDLEVFPSSNVALDAPPVEASTSNPAILEDPPAADTDESSISVMDRFSPPVPARKRRSKPSSMFLFFLS